MHFMEVITSKASKAFRDLSRLTVKKYRDREGLFLAEGPNITGEAISDSSIEVEAVYAREGSGYESFTPDTRVLSQGLFDRISDTMTSQGVISVIRKPVREDSRRALSEAASNGNVIVLDRLQDPGNTGTILRTAEGAGIGMAVFIKGTCDPFAPKTVRACAGSILRMPIVFFDSTEEFLEAAHDVGFRIAVTDVERGVPYYDAGLSDPEGHTALVIGNEGNGVSDTFKNAADILVNIPMKGKLESLNASIAAALLMYEMGRPKDK